MAKIIIIGAGLTGISAAYHLEQQNFFDYVLLEKDATIGGLCRSVVQDGFTFDYTGHLLHTSDPYFYTLLDTLCGINTFFNHIVRRSFIYSHNTYTHYPFQVNLHGLPAPVIIECIKGFIARKKSRSAPHSFSAWVLQQFGSGFARHFFFPYQKKIFAYNIHKLTASWTGRFVPQTSLEQILHGALQPPEQAIGYNAQFYYPQQGGIISWVQKLAGTLRNAIVTQQTVTAVDMNNKTITTNQGALLKYDYLINTMPLDRFLEILVEPSHLALRKARFHLLCNSVINFNFGIQKNNISDKHWIYFPEQQYPFYRLGFPHNFATSMVPPGCSSLYGELSYLQQSSKKISNTTNLARNATKKLLNISDQDILTEKIITIDHAYVIYDSWRDQHLAKLLQRLTEHNIYSIGRYGAWKYSSMQEAVLDGKNVTEQLHF